MGLSVSSTRSFWKDCTFIEYLAHLRDTAVDDIIKKRCVADDPLADAEHSSTQDIGCYSKTPKHKLYNDAQVPQIIEIVYPAFTAHDGTREPLRSLKVISTPRKGGVVRMELSCENLRLMAVAVQVCDYKRADDDGSQERIAIDEPNVRWARRSDGAMQLSCSYRSGNGKWKTHSKVVVNVNGDDELSIQMLRQAAAESSKGL